MLSKKCILYLSVLCAVSFVLFVQKNMMAQADSELRECNTCKTINIPTPPGNSDYSQINNNCNCDPYIPLSFSSKPEEITCGTDVNIVVENGCGSLEWTLTGNGYTLTKVNDNEYTLSCTGCSSCGVAAGQYSAVATVTVADYCGNISAVVRNTGGSWSKQYDGYACYGSHSSCNCSGGCLEGNMPMIIEGHKAWIAHEGGYCLSYIASSFWSKSKKCWGGVYRPTENELPEGGSTPLEFAETYGTAGTSGTTCSSPPYSAAGCRLYYLDYFEWSCPQ